MVQACGVGVPVWVMADGFDGVDVDVVSDGFVMLAMNILGVVPHSPSCWALVRCRSFWVGEGGACAHCWLYCHS